MPNYPDAQISGFAPPKHPIGMVRGGGRNDNQQMACMRAQILGFQGAQDFPRQLKSSGNSPRPETFGFFLKYSEFTPGLRVSFGGAPRHPSSLGFPQIFRSLRFPKIQSIRLHLRNLINPYTYWGYNFLLVFTFNLHYNYYRTNSPAIKIPRVFPNRLTSLPRG